MTVWGNKNVNGNDKNLEIQGVSENYRDEKGGNGNGNENGNQNAKQKKKKGEF